MMGYIKKVFCKKEWRWWQILVFVLFLAWFMGANLWLSWHESQTIDEAVHLTAGYSYITTGDFRLNPEHPPLLKELSALPLLALDVKNVKDLGAWESASEWKAGKEFVYSSNSSPRQIMFVARLMPIVVAVTLGLLIFLLATYFTNRSYGLLALGFYSLDPNIIAHSHLVTTDVASALGMLLTLATLFYYINKPAVKRLVLAGLAFGVALAFKFSTVFLFLFVGLLLILSVHLNQQKLPTSKKILSFIKKFAFVCLIAGAFLFAVYSFEVVRPSSNSAYAGNLANDNAIFNAAKNIPIPMYSYLRGLGRVFIHVKNSSSNELIYVMGNHATSKWYFFLAAALIKTPLATIVATALCLASGGYLLIKSSTKHKDWRRMPKNTWYILSLGLFILTYLAITALTTINIAWRYILPVYPALFVLIAIAFYRAHYTFKLSSLKMVLIGAALLVGLGISAANQWPYLLSYSNELLPIVDTRSDTIRLTDSNIDWSQDIYRLIDYAKLQPDKTFVYDLSTNVDMTTLGAPANLQPIDNSYMEAICKRDYPANIVLSYSVIFFGAEDSFACFRGLKPDFIVGSSILIFNP
jgi:hypothetical protein